MLEVARKREATDKLLDMMGTKKEEAEAQASMADKERDKADLAAREAGKLESQATSDLESAKPALEAARAALGQLDKAMLVELKGFSKLPTGVDKVIKIHTYMSGYCNHVNFILVNTVKTCVHSFFS
jgi:G3E family GTPase